MGIVASARAGIALVAAATVGALSLPAGAATYFASGTFHNSGAGPSALAVGDFNGDGRPDLAIAITLNLPGNNGKLGIQINNAAAASSPPFPLNIGDGQPPPGGYYDVGINPGYVVTGLFNGDAHLDIAVVNRGSNTVTILLNDGTGNFPKPNAGVGPYVTLSTGSSPHAAVVGDFNADGKADIAITNSGGASVSVYLGNGDGTFTEAASSPFATGTTPQGIDAADIDNDGVLDLVVANLGTNTISFHKGNNDGTFGPAVTKTTAFNSPVRVKAGFLDGDGNRDLAVAMAASPGGFEILKGDGTGAFTSVTTIAGDNASRFVLGRWEGDFRDDVALIRPLAANQFIKTFKGNPGATAADIGAYTALDDITDITIPLDIVSADFDGDGVNDIAAISSSAGGVNQYLQVFRKLHEAPAWIAGTATLATTVTQPPGGNLSQFLASGMPLPAYQFDGGGMPTGLSYNPTTGAITGAPVLGTTGQAHSITLTASNGTGLPTQKQIFITVAKAAQAVTFNPSDIQYSPGGPVQLTATSPATSSTFSWASLTPAVCTMDFAFVETKSVGTCTVTVQHDGDNDYLASPVVQRSFQITKASQSITFTAPATRRVGDGQFNFGIGGNQGTAFSTQGLTPIDVGSQSPGVCTVSVSPTVTTVGVGTCELTLNQAGNAIFAAAPQQIASFSVTANTAPGAPTVSLVNRGNGSATVHYFVATDNGGSAILGYTATCGSQSSAEDLNSPLTVSGLTNGVQVGCTVKARNAVGTGVASNSVNVTPALAPTITSATSANFTRTQAGTPFTATATGDPAPTFTFNGVLPTGVTFTNGVIAGTPALGSATAYLIEIVATNVGGTNSQFFTLNVAKLAQAINFTQPPDKAIGSGNASMTATVIANGPVTFGTTTPTKCTVANSNSIQLLAIGTCTVTANHGGDVDYLAAPQVSRSFEIIANTPDVPTNVIATPGNGQATFTFGPPASDGGSPVIDYTVTCNPGNLSVTGAGSPLVFTGLTNGTQYSCVLRPRNAVGLGGPWFVGVTPGKLANTINFTQPANVVFGSTPSVTLTATATAGTPVTFVSLNPAVCAIAPPNMAVLVNVGNCTVVASHPGDATYDKAVDVVRSFDVTGGPLLGVSPPNLDFGGQSMATTSAAKTVTVSNAGSLPLTITAVELSSTQFAQTNNCTSVPAGGTCTVNVTFTPAASTTASVPVNGALTVKSQEDGNAIVGLSGTGERSLVTHYYGSILGRAPDAGGKAFWAAEAARVQALGVNVNEVWFAMAQAFYFSGEYLALNRTNSGYITDLYNTFFNRSPDQPGLDYWVGQLVGGMPREVALASFMFSTEFANFTNAIFGNTAARAEVDAVVDFYRGLLARLPDDSGFNFWVGRFRAAQCSNPASGRAAAITAEVEAISSAYALSQEYTNRGRNNPQYVGDLYNAFLRRGGDLGGVLFWINQVASNAQTREQVRVQFKNSAEFSNRVNAIIAQGCLSN